MLRQNYMPLILAILLFSSKLLFCHISPGFSLSIIKPKFDLRNDSRLSIYKQAHIY